MTNQFMKKPAVAKGCVDQRAITRTMIQAKLASGLASECGFREAFEQVFGSPSVSNQSLDADAHVAVVRWFESPLGPMLEGATADGVCLLEFVDRRALQTQVDVLRKRLKQPMVPAHVLATKSPIANSSVAHPALAHLDQLATQLVEYFAGTRTEFTVKLLAPGTTFQAQVWEALRAIPPGKTRSYAQIAKAIGRPKATRAVARANGDNRLAILIPCHRVIGSDGSMTGYGGGIWRKEALLKLERCDERQNLCGLEWTFQSKATCFKTKAGDPAFAASPE